MPFFNFSVSSRTWKLLCLALAASASFGARADVLQECSDNASRMNRRLPQQINQITTLMNTICVAEGRNVMLIYRNSLSVANGSASQSNLDDNRASMVMNWCTDPNQRALLNKVDIQYTYSYPDGRLIGKINITRRDC